MPEFLLPQKTVLRSVSLIMKPKPDLPLYWMPHWALLGQSSHQDAFPNFHQQQVSDCRNRQEGEVRAGKGSEAKNGRKRRKGEQDSNHNDGDRCEGEREARAAPKRVLHRADYAQHESLRGKRFGSREFFIFLASSRPCLASRKTAVFVGLPAVAGVLGSEAAISIQRGFV